MEVFQLKAARNEKTAVYVGRARTAFVKAAKEAIEHAGVDPTDIDGIWLGHYNGGLVNDGFPSSLALQIDPQLRFTPSTRLENACASGSAAIHGARNAINSENAKIALFSSG